MEKFKAKSMRYLSASISEEMAYDVMSFRIMPEEGKEIESYAYDAASYCAKQILASMMWAVSDYADAHNLNEMLVSLEINSETVSLYRIYAKRKGFRKVQEEDLLFQRNLHETPFYGWLTGIYRDKTQQAFISLFADYFGEPKDWGKMVLEI